MENCPVHCASTEEDGFRRQKRLNVSLLTASRFTGAADEEPKYGTGYPWVPQSKRERSPRAVVLTINIHSPIDDIWKNSNREYIRHKCKEGVFEGIESVNELRIIC